MHTTGVGVGASASRVLASPCHLATMAFVAGSGLLMVVVVAAVVSATTKPHVTQETLDHRLGNINHMPNTYDKIQRAHRGEEFASSSLGQAWKRRS